MSSCKKDQENLWKVDIKTPAQKVEVVDISKEFYSNTSTLEEFKTKYPWFQGSVPDEDFGSRRQDTTEIKIYQDAIAKIDIAKLNTELTDLFSHVKHYFPDFVQPKVYLYSSALFGVMEPIFF